MARDYVIQILQNAAGFASEEDGAYIREFTPDTDALGRGTLTVTRRVEDALGFPSHAEAWKFWMQQSRRVPRRPDGKPNRPLTAYTVSILRRDDPWRWDQASTTN